MTDVNQNNQPTAKICRLKKLASCFKNFSPSKPFIAISCLLVGIGATLITQNLTHKNQRYLIVQNHFPFFPTIAFAESDLFSEINEMEKNMKKAFVEAQKNNSNSNTSKVSSREDSDYYYYQLDFSGFKKEDIVVGVKNGALSFSAENKKSEEDKENKTQSSTSFHYSFSIPKYNTGKEPEIIREDARVIVKLAKKK